MIQLWITSFLCVIIHNKRTIATFREVQDEHKGDIIDRTKPYDVFPANENDCLRFNAYKYGDKSCACRFKVDGSKTFNGTFLKFCNRRYMCYFDKIMEMQQEMKKCEFILQSFSHLG